QLGRANHFATKRLTNRLMAQTHSKQRNFPRESLDHVDRDSRTVWRSGAGRDHDPLRTQTILNLVERDAIVAPHFNRRAQLTEILDQVVSERIVVVDYQQHYFLHGLTTARLIFTGFSGLSPSTGAWLISSTISIPFVTVPNAANLLSRCGAGATSMKKCVVALFGSSVRAIETMPRTCLTRPGSSGSLCDMRFASTSPHFSLVCRLPP